MNKERIGSLFGISAEPEPSVIFKMFSEQVETLENAEQLAFLLLYGLHIEEINFNQFKALNVDEEEIQLGTDKYLTDFDFIQESEILHQKYRSVTKIFKDFPIVVEDNDNLLLIKEPYFEDDKFICPYIKEDLSDVQKLSIVEFLFNQWNKKSKKTVIKNIDWSKIDDKETENILGFNPITSVYPSEFACEIEVLPNYLIKWINEEEKKIEFISDFGVWLENSVVVELRKYLSDKIKDSHNNRLAQETRFNEDETTLFNSFEWLKEKEITLKTAEQFETFKKIVEVINDNRAEGELEIKEECDIKYLEEYSEKWEKIDKYTIYTYKGEFPIIVKLDEIEDYIFYRYKEGDYIVTGDKIYINDSLDKKKTLQKIASDENNDFTFEDLWQIFEEPTDETNKLKQEIYELKNQLQEQKQRQTTPDAQLGAGSNTDISINDQAEANREAKEIVKKKLKMEGFKFTEDIGKYSTINGVFKDNIEYPLVVKSYKYQDEPLKIGANEWIQLIQPNSMFWVYFGNDNLACLKLHDLLTRQDKLTISFSTENLKEEDRLEKFAQLLHYFKDVHFDFNNINGNDYNIARNLDNYCFNKREQEKDLSSDTPEIL